METPDFSPFSHRSESLELDSPGLYLNRELTWLEFNERVLHEAADERTPLLERLKFLAIVSNNLDEFFMKRVGGLKQQRAAGVQALTVDGRTPDAQIDECREAVHVMESEQQEVFRAVLSALEPHGIELLSYSSLTRSEQQELREYYIANVFPLLTPQVVSPAHPFPFISNLSLNLLVSLHNGESEEPLLARVKVPVGEGVSRFVTLAGGHRFVALEDLMRSNLDLLFPARAVVACDIFFVTRNAITEGDEEQADDLLALIEWELRERQFAPIVRMVVNEGMDAPRRRRLAAELGLEASDVFVQDGLIGMRSLFELAALDMPNLHYPPHIPAEQPLLRASPDVFRAIRRVGGLLLQHPYESFSHSVERFLRDASRDPKVHAIKMTLYRTSDQTKVVECLIDAARNGKQVAVVVELKARFDEAANIRWASRLEEAGVHVTYGVLGLKTHCKVILVVRRDFDGLRLYTHIGTGNYHAGTARLYDDLGLLTCDETIARDVVELFNFLTTGYTPRRTFKKLLTAPRELKNALVEKIRREVMHCEASGLGRVQLKVNALEDADITRELYRASQAGVEVDLIVRDTCRLRPGLAGLSENVRVMSVVGRFLEHSRIYYFHNGGEEEFYIGSADTMMRNLEQRVEVLVPVEPPKLQHVLRTIIELHLDDERAGWDMRSDGSYVQRMPLNPAALGCQEALMQLANERAETDVGSVSTAVSGSGRRRNISLAVR